MSQLTSGYPCTLVVQLFYSYGYGVNGRASVRPQTEPDGDVMGGCDVMVGKVVGIAWP